MHQQHLTVMQGAEANALIGPRRKPVRPVERPRAQFVAVEIAAPQMEQGCPHPVLARLRVLLHKADREERPHDAVDGPLGKPHLSGDLGKTQPAGAAREQAEDRRGSFDGLDRFGHGR